MLATSIHIILIFTILIWAFSSKPSSFLTTLIFMLYLLHAPYYAILQEILVDLTRPDLL